MYVSGHTCSSNNVVVIIGTNNFGKSNRWAYISPLLYLIVVTSTSNLFCYIFNAFDVSSSKIECYVQGTSAFLYIGEDREVEQLADKDKKATSSSYDFYNALEISV